MEIVTRFASQVVLIAIGALLVLAAPRPAQAQFNQGRGWDLYVQSRLWEGDDFRYLQNRAREEADRALSQASAARASHTLHRSSLWGTGSQSIGTARASALSRRVPQFAGSFSFNNPTNQANDTNGLKKSIVSALQSGKFNCSNFPQCIKVYAFDNPYRFAKIEFVNGFELELVMQGSVVRVESSELPLAGWQRMESVLQQLIVQNFAELGIKPQEHHGSDWVSVNLAHFDGPSYEDGAGYLTNVIVDFLNLQGAFMALGSLSDHATPPLPLAQMSKEQVKLVHAQVDLIDSMPDTRFSLFEMAKILNGDGKESPSSPLMGASGTSAITLWNFYPSHFRKLGAGKFAPADSARLIFKSLRPRAKMGDWVKILEIIENRMIKIQAYGDLIPFRPKPITRRNQALGHFREYLTGLEFAQYKTLLPQEWQDIPLGDYTRWRGYRLNSNASAAGACQEMFGSH